MGIYLNAITEFNEISCGVARKLIAILYAWIGYKSIDK